MYALNWRVSRVIILCTSRALISKSLLWLVGNLYYELNSMLQFINVRWWKIKFQRETTLFQRQTTLCCRKFLAKLFAPMMCMGPLKNLFFLHMSLTGLKSAPMHQIIEHLLCFISIIYAKKRVVNNFLYFNIKIW